jgi:hypothetical protein
VKIVRYIMEGTVEEVSRLTLHNWQSLRVSGRAV